MDKMCLDEHNWLFNRFAIDESNRETVLRGLMNYGINPINQRGEAKEINYLLRECLEVMNRLQTKHNINSFKREYECKWIAEYVISKNDIQNVYFNSDKKTTVVKWKNGTITKVKCQDGDTYNPELGLAMCLSKKALGNKGNYNDVFNKWLPKED